MHTRVGYAGGSTPDPTYHSIGDHTETLQIDYDPAVVAYEDLLDVFWVAHRPTTPPYSVQYASRIFVHDEAQRLSAVASTERAADRLGRLYTDILPLERFYLAEDYHQKYRLRTDRLLSAEFARMYPDAADLRESTAAARVNGYLDGWGSRAELEADLGMLGLSAEGVERLRRAVPGRAPREAEVG